MTLCMVEKGMTKFMEVIKKREATKTLLVTTCCTAAWVMTPSMVAMAAMLSAEKPETIHSLVAMEKID